VERRKRRAEREWKISRQSRVRGRWKEQEAGREEGKK